MEVDAAGHVTYTHQGARFAVGVRDESVQSLAKDAIAALELFDMTPGARVLVAATSKDADAAIRALREALTKGDVDVNETDFEKRTAMHIAATAGHMSVFVKFFI